MASDIHFTNTLRKKEPPLVLTARLVPGKSAARSKRTRHQTRKKASASASAVTTTIPEPAQSNDTVAIVKEVPQITANNLVCETKQSVCNFTEIKQERIPRPPESPVEAKPKIRKQSQKKEIVSPSSSILASVTAILDPSAMTLTSHAASTAKASSLSRPVIPDDEAKQPSKRRKKPHIASLQAPKALKQSRRVRPSLSSQLQSFMNQADDVMKDIQKMAGKDAKQNALLSVSSRKFVVGKLECKFPSMVHFHRDKCLYSFHHPFHTAKVINMEMYYQDMSQCVIKTRRSMFCFKIGHSLNQFGRDYQAHNPKHNLSILFNSGSDLSRFKTLVWPSIKRNRTA